MLLPYLGSSGEYLEHIVEDCGLFGKGRKKGAMFLRRKVVVIDILIDSW
jgi:hypothetical protein